MNIRLDDEKTGNQKYLGWMVRLNEVRRILAHSFGRSYTDKGQNFIFGIS